MKKRTVVWIMICALASGACAAGSGTVSSGAGTSNATQLTTEEEEVETEVDAFNRTVIAGALGVEEDDRNIRFFLGVLNEIGAGKVQQAQLREEDDRRILRIVAEDATEYDFYISADGSVEAVENLMTGEWPFMVIK